MDRPRDEHIRHELSDIDDLVNWQMAVRRLAKVLGEIGADLDRLEERVERLEHAKDE